MRTIVSIVTIALSLISAACAYEAPTAPTPTPVNPTVPFSITLGSTTGSGTTADHATITAKVQGPSGAPVSGVTVTFSTTAGELNPTQAPTASDGVGRTVLVSSTAATVTAKVGTLSASTAVSTQPAAPATPTPTPTPAPSPAPAPTPQPGTIILNLPGTGTTGVAVSMFISAPSTAGPWTWTFGDGSNVQTATLNTSHTFVTAGTYTVTVTSSGGSASGKITISDPPPPPAPPPTTPTPVPAYTVTLTANPSSVIVNTTGVTLTANVTQQNGAPLPTSFAWDCGTGAPPITTANATQVCPGPYAANATAKVTATGGTVSGSGTTTITVTPPPVPVITVSCTQQASPPNTLSCVVSATLNGSPVPSTSITHVDWDWGDGTPLFQSTINLATHAYAFIGSYRISALNVAVTGTTATGTGVTTKQLQ